MWVRCKGLGAGGTNRLPVSSPNKLVAAGWVDCVPAVLEIHCVILTPRMVRDHWMYFTIGVDVLRQNDA